MAQHMFRARTVIVGEKGPLAAYQALMKVMNTEGQTREVRLNRRYEKPTVKKHRLQYERAQKIYNENMKGKVALLLKGQRSEYPWS